MTVVLWVLFLVPAIIVGFLLIEAMRETFLARRGKGDAELFGFRFAYVIIAGFLLSFPGGIAGILLATSRDTLAARLAIWIPTGGLLVLSLAVIVVIVGGAVDHFLDVRTANRVISQQKMIAMIRSGEINAFSHRDEEVHVTYTNTRNAKGKYLSRRPKRADAAGYYAYVMAARDAPLPVRHDSTEIDPVRSSHRWITVAVAERMINEGWVPNFAYGPPDIYSGTPTNGEPTGIRLIENGGAPRCIYVEPAMEPTLIPIAWKAQERTGRPRFWIGGRHEPAPPRPDM